MEAATTQRKTGQKSRRVLCARCGGGFDCGSGGREGGCWCADEPYRMPMPVDAAQDCLCHACLRAAAALQGGPPA